MKSYRILSLHSLLIIFTIWITSMTSKNNLMKIESISYNLWKTETIPCQTVTPEPATMSTIGGCCF